MKVFLRRDVRGRPRPRSPSRPERRRNRNFRFFGKRYLTARRVTRLAARKMGRSRDQAGKRERPLSRTGDLVAESIELLSTSSVAREDGKQLAASGNGDEGTNAATRQLAENLIGRTFVVVPVTEEKSRSRFPTARVDTKARQREKKGRRYLPHS